MKLTLVKPSEAYIEEIRAFRQEFAESGLQFNGVSGLQAVEDVSAWINRCRKMENRAYAESLGFVAGEQFMLVDDRRVLGMIAFRHSLNESLEKVGGHIGYSIRPCEQRKGYAKAMLALCLEKCRAFGLNKVLITCDEENIASRKTILAHGGLFAGKVLVEGHYTERYWVPCGEERTEQ
ncbi:MAG: GNAT family N-acetyltransferase [Oscillospiraceae bacterium]|jgi:predicted acetyltransferase|nr:GNAT family N-acetyltransferase [Oscillospiraceae bacterium]